MKIRAPIFSLGMLLLTLGCTSHPSSQTLNDGLSASMSDQEILQVLRIDATKVNATKTVGKDGFSMVYTDGLHRFGITRSVVSGVIVMILEPASQRKTWELGRP